MVITRKISTFWSFVDVRQHEDIAELTNIIRLDIQNDTDRSIYNKISNKKSRPGWGGSS
jgi:hypothetical protein